jgi:hypothetical protein
MLGKLQNYPSSTSLLNAETDGKQVKNPLKYLLNTRWSKKTFLDSTSISDTNNNSDLSLGNTSATFSSKFFNEDLTYRFKDLQSANQQLLTSERNTRLIGGLAPNKTILNFNDKGSSINSLLYNTSSKSLTNPQYALYSSSALE